MTPLAQDIDTMRDVYMLPSQRKAYDRIVEVALSTEAPVIENQPLFLPLEGPHDRKIDWTGGDPQPSLTMPNTFAFHSLAPPTAPNIRINKNDGTAMVTIKATGEIEYGPDYTPDAAAKIFWEAMGAWRNTEHEAKLAIRDATIAKLTVLRKHHRGKHKSAKRKLAAAMALLNEFMDAAKERQAGYEARKHGDVVNAHAADRLVEIANRIPALTKVTSRSCHE